MNTRSLTRSARNVLATGLLAVGIGTAHAQGIPQVPQIPAFLPTSANVPMGEAMAIDGEWTISSLGKRIRFEGGRAYAVDPWLHMFVLQIQPGMVVLQNIQRAADGSYQGDDLPLMGKFNASFNATGGLDVRVAGMLGPVSYQLIPVTLDDRARFEAARTGEDPSLAGGEDADEAGIDQQADDEDITADEGQ